jgi:hypothetical protein
MRRCLRAQRLLLLKQPAQLIRFHSGITENAGERAALELAMQRHSQRDPSVGVLHADVTATLPCNLLAGTFESFDGAAQKRSAVRRSRGNWELPSDHAGIE